MEGFFTASQIQSSRPQSTLAPKCGACGLYKGCKSPKMRPSGSGRSGILIVGEAPGETEDEMGKPFVGKSGQYLRDAVGRAGGEWSELRFTNAIICHPPNNKMPKKGREIGWCRPNLFRTIEEMKPRVIITLGRSALEAVLSPFWKDDWESMDRWTGHKIPLEKHWVCPSWHPSYLLREDDRMMDKMFVAHLAAAFDLDDKPPAHPNYKSQIEIMFDERKVWEALRDFNFGGKAVAFDYETNSLKPEYPKSRIWTASVSDGERTIAYPWTDKTAMASSLLLRSGDVPIIASNAKFENRWTIRHLGHPIKRIGWDTVIAAHVMDNRAKIASLKFQSFVQMGIPTYNDKVAPYLESAEGSHYNRIHEADLNEVLLYNGCDSLFEKLLAVIQREALRAWGRSGE